MKSNISYQFPITCILLIVLFSCKETNNKNISAKDTTTQAVPLHIKKPPGSFNDTLYISKRSAVFFSVDSLQLKALEEIMQKNVFESMTHESFFQMRNARLVIKKYWPGLTIIETSKHRWLAFIDNTNSKTTIDLNEKNDISGIFLFEPEKKPEMIDMMNIDTALGFYFEK